MTRKRQELRSSLRCGVGSNSRITTRLLDHHVQEEIEGDLSKSKLGTKDEL